MDSLAEVVASPWFLGIVVPLVSVVLSVWLTLRFTRRHGSLRLTAWNNTLVTGLGSQVSGIAVTYQGVEVTSVSVGRIVLWNDGKVLVKSSDVEVDEPLVVELASGVHLLDVTPLLIDGKHSKLVATRTVGPKGGEAVRLSFDHLKPREGGAFQLVHTGTSTKDFLLSGAMTEFPPPSWVGIRRTWLSNLYAVIYMGFVLGLPLLLFLPFDTPSQKTAKALYVTVLAAAGLGLFLARRKLRQLLLRVPTALRPYCEGISQSGTPRKS